MNTIVILGNIGQEPELKMSKSGTSYCRFSIATSRRFKNEDGEYDTDWHDVVCFGKTAEFVDKYFSKGSRIAVQGELQSSTWISEGNETHKSWTIHASQVDFAERRTNGDTPVPARKDGPKEPDGGFAKMSEEDDDLPF